MVQELWQWYSNPPIPISIVSLQQVRVKRRPDQLFVVPTDLPVWTWLFDSPYSPLSKFPQSEIKGYTNALTKEHISYADVKRYTTYLSTALIKKYGLKPGQTVSLFSQNSVWYPVAMLGVLRTGGVVSGASPAYNVEEMTYALKTANAKFLMTTPTSMKVAAAATKNAGIPQERIFLLEGEMAGFTTISQLLSLGASYGEHSQTPPFAINPTNTNKDIVGYLSFSSGTTGLPKAVMISHANVIAQCLQIAQITPANHKKILAVLPLFHITGLVHQLHLPILLNANVYMLPSFTLPSMLDTVVEYQIEELLLVPPILIRMVRDQKTLKNYNLSHLHRFSSGAAPLSPEILTLLEQTFPGTGFKQGYGMTESCSCITAHPPDKYASRVGTIVASTEVKIVNPDSGRECGINQPGEIWAKGPQIVMGYLDNERATKETFDEEGWLHTGDIGMVDEEGLVSITDRLKEMIKVKGIGVAPAELEDLLLGHPTVEDVAVMGVEDERAGERPKAFVVLKEEKEPRREDGDVKAVARDLIRYVREKKDRNKWIVEVEVVAEIPKSASGKILRRVLRDQAGKGMAFARVLVRDDRARAKL
jgi:4-coumarate--CoA ligase